MERLSQLRPACKYKVGLMLAHQNLGQFAVMASPAIKLAGGGVSVGARRA